MPQAEQEVRQDEQSRSRAAAQDTTRGKSRSRAVGMAGSVCAGVPQHGSKVQEARAAVQVSQHAPVCGVPFFRGNSAFYLGSLHI